MRKTTLIAATLLPAIAGAQGLPRARAESVGMSATTLERIAPAMQAFVDSGRFAGITMAVARHGKVVYTGAVGTMDSARTKPMRTDAVFRIYSMTKPVTTVAIMQLYEQGKLALDDPVSKYIPGFASTQLYVSGPSSSPVTRAPDRQVTIADLMRHTSGLTYGAFGNSPVDSMYQRAGILSQTQTIDSMTAHLAKIPLLYSPGTRWNYSVGLDVAGRIVEIASGMSFDAYLAKNVFAPLMMRSTSFHATPAIAPNLTTVFTRVGGQLRAGSPLVSSGYRKQDPAFFGGQGLLSTMDDYLRLAQMLLNGGELDGKRVLKKETVALIMKNELPPGVPFAMMRGYGFGFGGAVRVDSAGGNEPAEGIGTYRWSGYASTFFWVDPKNDLIGLVWAQMIPTNSAIETPFERIVYSAITGK